MTEKELKDRTKLFALRVIKLVNSLPNDFVGRAIGNQLVSSGTSVAANYRAACRGRSRAEFIAKLGTVEERKLFVAGIDNRKRTYRRKARRKFAERGKRTDGNFCVIKDICKEK